jgi:hypothetical protein
MKIKKVLFLLTAKVFLLALNICLPVCHSSAEDQGREHADGGGRAHEAGPNLIKLFLSVIYEFSYARVFFPGELFYPSLTNTKNS